MTKDDILESLLILQAIHLELINFSDSITVNHYDQLKVKSPPKLQPRWVEAIS